MDDDGLTAACQNSPMSGTDSPSSLPTLMSIHVQSDPHLADHNVKQSCRVTLCDTLAEFILLSTSDTMSNKRVRIPDLTLGFESEEMRVNVCLKW